MASKEAIQKILQAEYSSTRWKAFLSDLFTSSSFYSNPTPLTGINASIASQALHIGNITLNDNGISRGIAVYEVMLAENVVLERNRVGLRNLLKPHWKEQDAAFIVYYHPQNKSWRFSYVSELRVFTENGYVPNNTEPKRFTYVLGENESCRTAAIQFSKLQDKASNATLDDVKEAFSVEKMSGDFFREYKEHYQDFVEFLTGKRLEKVAGKWEEVVKKAPDTQLISIFNGNEKDVRDFCKKLLGRIVFLYFIQKKGWLGVPVTDDWGKGNYNYLSGLFNNCRNPAIFYSEYLSKLFFDTLNQQRPQDAIEIIPGEPCRIPYLNGGLFEEDDQNYRNLVLEANLFKRLFEFFDQYNFTIYEDDPNDHTVAVDPEMLGHIFENLLEDNKDKGAFYTPKEIVHYMCQESLIEYLTTWFEGKNYKVQQDTFISFDNAQQASFLSANEGRTGQGVLEIAQPSQSNSKVIDRSLIEKLLKKQLSDEDKQAVIKHAAEFNQALDKVKICDPAIGSGAFPMGLLLEIFTAKQTIHIFTHGDLTTFEPATVKLNIIQNSIYGVDIERGAVDIARLRFWLSLVVDEPEPQPLPNLDYKIVVGNSLISKLGDDVIEIDWDVKKQVTFDMFGADETGKIKQTLTELNQLQKAFFNSQSDKKALAPKIRNLKIDLLTQQLNLMIETRGLKVAPRKMATQSQKDFVAQTELYLQTQGWLAQISQLQALKIQTDKTLDFFDWQLNFAEVMNSEVADDVGFDIVIGNPPYGAKLSDNEKDLFKQVFEDVHMRTPDTFNYFTSKSLYLTKISGVISFIVPNNLLFQTEYEKTRRLLIEYNRLITAFNLGDGVFESATVPSCIFLVKKFQNSGYKEFGYADLRAQKSSHIDFNKFIQNKSVSQIKDIPALVFGVSSDDFPVLEKISNISWTIDELALEVASGISTGGDKIFRVSEEKAKELNLEQHLLRPVLVGGEIDKYKITDTKHLVIYTDRSTDINQYEFVQKYLLPFKDKLNSRSEARSGVMPWYSLNRQRYPELFEEKKIIMRQTSDCIRATFDDKSFYCVDSILVFKLKSSVDLDYKFCLAVLNSKVNNFAYKNFTQEEGRTFAQVKPKNVRKLFIPKVAMQHQKPVIDLVDQIFALPQGSSSAKLEQKLDYIIYKLYKLSYAEVKTIDPNIALSEAEFNSI
ncbi:MAG TPA: N-6 DNA methylase [Methylotenera sp.]|nr:N-6 DNA methylase [Methylotenera sp.]HPM49640.1 N-6 DNA methylase [Methylotenera sp.]